MDYKKKDGTVVTKDWMDALSDAADADELPGTVVATMLGAGRPRLYEDDELETVTFRLPKSRIRAISAMIEKNGETRSQFLRKAVEKALIG
jgi:hypothetical protein